MHHFMGINDLHAAFWHDDRVISRFYNLRGSFPLLINSWLINLCILLICVYVYAYSWLF